MCQQINSNGYSRTFDWGFSCSGEKRRGERKGEMYRVGDKFGLDFLAFWFVWRSLMTVNRKKEPKHLCIFNSLSVSSFWPFNSAFNFLLLLYTNIARPDRCFNQKHLICHLITRQITLQSSPASSFFFVLFFLNCFYLFCSLDESECWKINLNMWPCKIKYETFTNLLSCLMVHL